MFLMTFGTTLRRTEAGLHELGGGDVVGGRFVTLAAGGIAHVRARACARGSAAVSNGHRCGWLEVADRCGARWVAVHLRRLSMRARANLRLASMFGARSVEDPEQ